MLRPDGAYTQLEARVLDLALVLHAEHGGGNNSAFAVHVVASSGTDTYSAIAAALGSLKGPLHGGANNRVMAMMDDIKEAVKNWDDEDEITAYLLKIMRKEVFDRSGLIYGVGHAVYSLSDPRAILFEEFVQKLSKEKGREDEYKLYTAIARLAPQIIAKEKKMYKGVSANIDFFSGFVYEMLNLPREMFTPIFAVSRIAGWSAHMLEETISGGRIIRPAYKSVSEQREYVPIGKR
jgi:citrate synthase